MSSDGKPISQIFADELDSILKKFEDSGLENSQAIGVFVLKTFDLLSEIRDANKRPF